MWLCELSLEWLQKPASTLNYNISQCMMDYEAFQVLVYSTTFDYYVIIATIIVCFLSQIAYKSIFT